MKEILTKCRLEIKPWGMRAEGVVGIVALLFVIVLVVVVSGSIRAFFGG